MGGAALPTGVTVFERGWLSSNSILLRGGGPIALVDSGYCTHADQTVALVRRALGRDALDVLVNTRLHSDHCGGNAALQSAYPGLRTLAPPGHAEAVRRWDTEALTFQSTGQTCPRFRLDDVLVPGSVLQLGGHPWEVHAAPGHDPHSVVLFEPRSRTLISADALWEQGFGVVFPELEGAAAFDDVGATLDMIERLQPALVVPGHGRPFTDVAGALAFARLRLDGFVANPAKHTRYGAKVLLKFKLLERQRFEPDELLAWARGVRYFELIREQAAGVGLAGRPDASHDLGAWLQELGDDLVRSGAARFEGQTLINV